MRTAICAIVGIWFVCMVALASDPMSDYEKALTEATKLKKQYQGDLDRIAGFVSESSRGRSKLMLDKRAGADPQVGHWLRSVGWEDTPQVSFYQVSSPVRTKIDAQSCEILGAARFVAPVSPVSGHGGAKAGVYMLARLSAVGGRPAIALISVSEGKDGKLKFKKQATIYATDSVKAAAKVTSPSLAVSFPAANTSAKNPAWRFRVAMAWKGRSYEFAMDLEAEFT
jgi:hypothetical protein